MAALTLVLRTNQTLSHSLKVIKISVGMASNRRAVNLDCSKYAQIATEKGPNSLYCLGVRLTTYIQSSQKEATIVVSKLTENNLCRLFSNNIVATSVVVNSTALNSNAPTRVIFLLLTKEINYAAMKSWFAMNLDSVRSHY
ncbi:unnamed protein product [Brassica oleracea]|uniref:Hexosyltransferase n=1 Tax=Brassica oleracea TaxID=3712 RepID=A0A3P6G6Z4_BRAOL|nr:unnamed protein product [Brassica oleracea]